MTQERKGELILLAYLPIFGFFPIITSYGTKIIPPILFAGISLLLGSVLLFFYLVAKGDLKLCKNTKALKYIVATTILNLIIPFIFIFIGSSLTSGINTSLLSQTELLFTFLVCGFIFHETITIQKTIGAATILIGTIAIIYNGTFSLNWGDLLIVAGQLFYPFGNRYSKMALAMTKPTIVLFLRNLWAGLALIVISFLFETQTFSDNHSVKEIVLLILANGIFIHGISKLVWLAGLKRLDITKAISIIIATPAFSLIYAFFFLKEIPTVYQLVGFFVIMGGLFILTRQREEHLVEMA